MDQLAALRDRIELLEERFDLFRRGMFPREASEWAGLSLTKSEWVILDALSNGHAWHSLQLLVRLDALLPIDDGHSESTLRARLCYFRKKLRALSPPIRIATIGGLGYRLSPENVSLLIARRIG